MFSALINLADVAQVARCFDFWVISLPEREMMGTNDIGCFQ
jgi:hypothetical protein